MPEQAKQSWNPERYVKNAAFVGVYGLAVLDLLQPQKGETILDLGCGDGALTKRLVEAGAIVKAVDASPEQVEGAKAHGLDAQVCDARHLPFEQDFDAVFSNAVLHWVKEPDLAIDGVWRALKPGGRFVGEMGGQGNVERIRSTLHQVLASEGIDAKARDPWYFPDPADYSSRLAARGFEVISAELIERPTPLPGHITGWLETFAESFLGGLDGTLQARVLGEVEKRLAAKGLKNEDGSWWADYVRLRFKAIKHG